MDNIAIKVDSVSKTFKLPHEKHSSVKSAIINLVRGGDRSYEKLQALKDVSFEIKKGEFFGIVGRNGSGKSTLLKLLAGIYSPDKGVLDIRGSLTPFIELGVGFSPELTGRENIFLNGALLGFGRNEMNKMYDGIVEFAELKRFMDQKLKNYSSGMQVRLAFSIAIKVNSDILLLDEILAVGDAAFQKKCFGYFRELKKKKKTVVFISHDMNAIREYCDRAILIEKGTITNSGTPEEIAVEYTKLFMNTDDIEESADHKHWGTQKAKILQVQVTGIDDDTVTVIAECVFKEPAKEPIFGFYIHNPMGNKLVETNTKWSRIKTGSFATDQMLKIIWRVPNIFTNGKHSVSMAIANNDGTEYFDWWEGAKYFSIDKDEVTTALTLPKQQIIIERS